MPRPYPAFAPLVERIVDARDALAFRRLQGDPLTRRERALLWASTALLSAVLPSPRRLPRHVRKLVSEVLRGRR